MTHLSEEQLIGHYYGEPESAEPAVHLAVCEQCRREYDALARTLDSCDYPVPERLASYEAAVWHRLEPKLARRSWSFWWKAAPALAGLVVVAFLAGQWIAKRGGGRVQPAAVSSASAISGKVRERILLVAMGDHLERSQMVIAELVNTRASGAVDISDERRRAQDLVQDNRLFRQTAVKSGDGVDANVLDELERVLLEIAHSPSQIPSPEFENLQRRIEAQGILFKIRVVGTTAREKGNRL